MKKLIENYNRTIEQLNKRILELKNELKSGKVTGHNELDKIRQRIEILRTERSEMSAVCCQMMRYLRPKPQTPSLLARAEKAGA